MLSEATLGYGGRVAGALLGLDALDRLESGDEEGVVVVNLDEEGVLERESFAGYSEGRRFFQELQKEAASLPEADRRIYYQELCHSTLAFISWRHESLPFEGQIANFLHVPAEPASEAELDLLRKGMGALLDRMGYGGDLRAQCASWEERTRVPREAVPQVVAELMDEAWDRTEERLLEIPASKADGMRVVMVSGMPFNARCDYLSRNVELNADPVLTRPGLKHLVVHECYPGHFVQFKMRQSLVRSGEAPADGLLSVVNSASSSVFEGIGDSGVVMLDWMESDDDRLQALANRYRAGIGTGAAWRLHALGWDEEHVAEWLRSQCLLGGEGWVSNRMRFIAAPARATLIWSYWWGERVVGPAWERAKGERRAEFLRYLYGRMHSNSSVRMFP
jgi:hypothetical protein